MSGLGSLLAGAAAPAVRKPAFEISFGAAGADEWARALASVSVEAGLAPAVDATEVVLAAREDAPSAALEDAGDVALGFEDEGPLPVFAGSVHAVHRTLSGRLRVTAGNGGATLAAFRLDQGYEKQSAGAIVRDLAGRAGIDTGPVDDGAELPYYVVDSRTTAWQHVAELAALSGFAAWIEADGRLHFGPLTAGGAAQAFTYGEDVIELAARQSAPAPGSVTVVGEGAAGSNGDDAWSWHVKDASSVRSTAGSGSPATLVQSGALRSSGAVAAAAEGAAARATRGAVTARLLVPGAPKATVGAKVEIAGAPDAALNGAWLVQGLRHRLVKSRGYTTLLLLAKSASGGPT